MNKGGIPGTAGTPSAVTLSSHEQYIFHLYGMVRLHIPEYSRLIRLICPNTDYSLLILFNFHEFRIFIGLMTLFLRTTFERVCSH